MGNGKLKAFTLMELLVVISIIALLTSILMPSLARAKELARGATCHGNLHSLGIAAVLYQSENDNYYWPYVLFNHPAVGQKCYFWGTATDPVDHNPSPLLKYCDFNPAYLWCPSLQWGSYVPQGGVNEPTTTYGYNAWCLDPAIWGRVDDQSRPMERKRSGDLKNPHDLFVFADSGMSWSPGGVPVFQNSTSLDPVTLGAWGANTTPTTHFRHNDRTNALCADGHADSFGLESGQMLQPDQKLGFAGAENVPHYDQ